MTMSERTDTFSGPRFAVYVIDLALTDFIHKIREVPGDLRPGSLSLPKKLSIKAGYTVEIPNKACLTGTIAFVKCLQTAGQIGSHTVPDPAIRPIQPAQRRLECGINAALQQCRS